MNRYQRNIQLPEIGMKGQEMLLSKHVLLVGAGALGNAIAPYLVGAGVGELTIVDGDRVRESNLQRQVFFTEQDVGKLKALCLAERLKKLNSTVKVNFVSEFLDVQNGWDLTLGMDVIVDAVDQIGTRYLLNDLAIGQNVAMVFGAVHEMEGQFGALNYQNGCTYRCIFPEKTTFAPVENCNDLGVIGMLPGIIGMHQALLVVQVLLQVCVKPSGITLVNVWNNTFQHMEVERNENQVKLAKEKALAIQEKSAEGPIQEITYEKLKALLRAPMKYQFLSIQEEVTVPNQNVIHIPYFELEERWHKLNRDQPIVVMCDLGQRSIWATRFLQEQNFKQIFHVRDGVLNYLENE